MAHTEVLIVGAGPSGLVLALWLHALGVAVRIVDAAPGPGTTSRALVVQARTLELYRLLGLARAVVDGGYPIPAVNLWAEGEHRTRVELGALGGGLTPYPFVHVFPQDLHEALLVTRLRELGIEVERNCSLVDFEEHGSEVLATLRRASGQSETCSAAWLAGCDGARSSVRHLIEAGFPGGTYRQVFYVADIEGDSPALNGELHIDLDEADILAVFAMGPSGRARLVGTVRDERAARAASLQFADVSRRAIDNLLISVQRLNWFSTYRVHHRVASTFRRGRAFLVGDAGHIHSPAGGQGMNTGIGDAFNLGWKLAAVLRGQAGASLLDSYEAERLPFARRLVDTTDRAFSVITADGAVAEVVRTGLVPRMLPLMARFKGARRGFFRLVSQTALRYRHAPLNMGSAGAVQGGERLPWLANGARGGDTGARGAGPGSLDGEDNFQPLARPGWQAHVYGTASPELATWCALHGVPLRRFDWSDGCAAAGLGRDALYLLRPDTYVGLAAGTPTPGLLDDYLRLNGLTLQP